VWGLRQAKVDLSVEATKDDRRYMRRENLVLQPCAIFHSTLTTALGEE